MTISEAWDIFWVVWHAAPIEEQQAFAAREARSLYVRMQTELMASLQRLSPETWEVSTDRQVCDECGMIVPRTYRLKKAPGYSRMRDKRPKYRCEACSIRKYQEIQGGGRSAGQ